MPTMNFSIPANVKDAFNALFEKRNKSAIVAELMLEAIEREVRWRGQVHALGAQSGDSGANPPTELQLALLLGPNRVRR